MKQPIASMYTIGKINIINNYILSFSYGQVTQPFRGSARSKPTLRHLGSFNLIIGWNIRVNGCQLQGYCLNTGRPRYPCREIIIVTRRSICSRVIVVSVTKQETICVGHDDQQVADKE